MRGWSFVRNIHFCCIVRWCIEPAEILHANMTKPTVGVPSPPSTNEPFSFAVPSLSSRRWMSAKVEETDAEFDARYEAFFNRKDIDGWEIRKVRKKRLFFRAGGGHLVIVVLEKSDLFFSDMSFSLFHSFLWRHSRGFSNCLSFTTFCTRIGFFWEKAVVYIIFHMYILFVFMPSPGHARPERDGPLP